MTDSDDGMLLPEPEPQPESEPAPARPPATQEKRDAPRTRASSSSSSSSAASSKAADEDLSAEIIKQIPRERGEQVTCRRITKNHYRCNWWRAEDTAAYDNPSMSGLLVTTNRICKSQFLRVTRAESARGGSGGSGGPGGAGTGADALCITVVPPA